MTAFILGRAIEMDYRERQAVESLDLIRAAYFAEYTDATEMDSDFAESFQKVFDLLCPSGEDRTGREVESFLTRPE